MIKNIKKHKKTINWIVGVSLVIQFFGLLHFTNTSAKVIGWGLWIAAVILLVSNVVLIRKTNKLSDS